MWTGGPRSHAGHAGLELGDGGRGMEVGDGGGVGVVLRDWDIEIAFQAAVVAGGPVGGELLDVQCVEGNGAEVQLEVFEGARCQAAAPGAVCEDVGSDVVGAAGVIVQAVAADGVGSAVEEWVGADIVDGFGPVPVRLISWLMLR